MMACWSLWLMPALCMGGMLAHACPTEERGCGPDDHGHDDHGHDHHGHDDAPMAPQPVDDCNHESDCSSDPCAGSLAIAGRLGDDVVEFIAAVALAPGVSTPCSRVIPAWFDPVIPDAAPPPLPIHDSDIPLLI